MVQRISWKIVLFLTLIPFELLAEIYIFSYQSSNSNYVNLSESFSISKSMTPIKISKYSQPLILENGKSEQIYEIFSNNKDKILEFLFKYGIDVKSSSYTKNFITSSSTNLTFKSSYINVNQTTSFTEIRLIQIEY